MVFGVAKLLASIDCGSAIDSKSQDVSPEMQGASLA